MKRIETDEMRLLKPLAGYMEIWEELGVRRKEEAVSEFMMKWNELFWELKMIEYTRAFSMKDQEEEEILAALQKGKVML